MSKVYIVQKVVRVQKNSDGKVESVREAFNFDPARVYGELEYVLDYNPGRFSARQIVNDIKRGLRDFSRDDYLIPVGDPSVIGITIAIACRMTNGKIRTLRWDKQIAAYSVVEYDINV